MVSGNTKYRRWQIFYKFMGFFKFFCICNLREITTDNDQVRLYRINSRIEVLYDITFFRAKMEI